MEKIEFRFLKNNADFTIQKNKYENMVFFYENNKNYSYFSFLIRDFYLRNKFDSILNFNCCFNIFKDKRENNYFLNIEKNNDFNIFEKEDSIYDILEKSNTVFTIEINYEEFICNFLNKLNRNNEKEKAIVIHLGKENLSEEMKQSIINVNKKGYFVIFYIDKSSIGFDDDLFHMKFYENEFCIDYKYNDNIYSIQYLNYKYNDNIYIIQYLNKEEDFHEVYYSDNIHLYKEVDYLNMNKILVNF